jgi:hypothetical protein
MSEPKKLNDGRYYVNIGYTTADSREQPKLMLGRDRAEAILRAALIEKLWDRSVEIARIVSGEAPSWDETALVIAKRIAAGDKTVVVDLVTEAMPDTAVSVLQNWQNVVPGIKLQMRDTAGHERGVQMIRKEADHHLARAKQLLDTGGSHTLSEAITTYTASIKVNPRYLISDKSRLTDWGRGKVDLIEFCCDHMPDVQLSKLTMRQITELLDILAARPFKKSPAGVQTDIPISRKYARTAIKEFRRFLDWLHESDDFIWDKPRDYAVKPIRVKKDTHHRGPVRVKTYDLNELVVLWRYTTPWERCLMALALNSAFGMSEIATLTRDEVLLRCRHPHADVFRVEIRSPLGLRRSGSQKPHIRSVDTREVEFHSLEGENPTLEPAWEDYMVRFVRSAVAAGFRQVIADGICATLHEMAENVQIHAASPVGAVAGYHVTPGVSAFTIVDVGGRRTCQPAHLSGVRAPLSPRRRSTSCVTGLREQVRAWQGQQRVSTTVQVSGRAAR